MARQEGFEPTAPALEVSLNESLWVTVGILQYLIVRINTGFRMYLIPVSSLSITSDNLLYFVVRLANR